MKNHPERGKTRSAARPGPVSGARTTRGTFAPGVSGNPGGGRGRPKGTVPLAELLRRKAAKLARAATTADELAAAARAMKAVSEVAPELDRADTSLRGVSEAGWRSLLEVIIGDLCPACRVGAGNRLAVLAGELAVGEGKGSEQAFAGKSADDGGSREGDCASANVAGVPSEVP